MFALQRAVEPVFDQPLARAEDGREAGVEGFRDPAVAPTFARFGDIGFQQDTRFEEFGGGVFALVDQRFKRFALLWTKPDDIFLNRDLWHDPIPDDVVDVARESQIIVGINDVGHYVLKMMEDKPLPMDAGGRGKSLWFTRQLDGWWTTIRYGSSPIPMTDKGDTAMLIGDKLEDVAAFYDAVADSIAKGELDGPIGKLQADRSASLKGSH